MNEALPSLCNALLLVAGETSPAYLLRLSLFLILWALLWLVPMAGLFYVAYYLLSLPLRRRERARFFLGMLEAALARGQSPEHGIIAASSSRDPGLGVRFHLLAAHVELGLHLDEALRRVPGFLPLQVIAMLQVGRETGNLPGILEAARKLAEDGRSQVRSGANYLLLLLLFSPGVPLVLGTLSTFVFPRLRTIFEGLAPTQSLPWLARTVFEGAWWLQWIPIVLSLAIVAAAICYLGGPRLFSWASNLFGDLPHRLSDAVPWRRKRLERDFTFVLALLLDAGVPEPTAVRFAANSTANVVFMRRGDAAVARLSGGTTLADALAGMDESKQLGWRLANAAHGSTGFVQALAGWIEALDAKAFQEEQSAAQVTTSALVLFNGALVGVVAVAVFQLLIGICREGILW